eukprot:Gb_00294 [translate_table: standard]
MLKLNFCLALQLYSLALLLLLISHSSILFHARLYSDGLYLPISHWIFSHSPTAAKPSANAVLLEHASANRRNREPILYAVQEEPNGYHLGGIAEGDGQMPSEEHAMERSVRKWVKRSASLQEPPKNVSKEERIKWLKENWPAFKILHSDSISTKFAARAKAFFFRRKPPCKQRFFMTWISSPKSFGHRERLSLESVFKYHPFACVLIISRTLDSQTGRDVLRPFAGRGFRVMAAAPDLGFLFHNTPAEQWLMELEKGNIDPGEIPFAQNLSNILRLAALYRYGGIYIDTDVILLRSFSNLRNVIGAQNKDTQSGRWNRLNNAVMVLEKLHPLLFKFIQEFALTFDGNKWGHNGPYLLTRVVSRLMNQGRDLNVSVVPPMAFYPVDWSRISGFFSNPSGDANHAKWRAAKLLQVQNHSYAIHLWNRQSGHLSVEPGSIVHHLFAQHCLFCHHHAHRRPS